MKKIIRTALTAGLLAFIGVANAQETDTTTYSSNTYNQDTSSYQDTYREQQGEDTFNNSRNETEYSDNESMRTDQQRDSDYSDEAAGQRDKAADQYQGSNTGEGSNDPQGTLDSNSGMINPQTDPAQDTTGIGGNYRDENINQQNDPAGTYTDPRRESSDEGPSTEPANPENTPAEYYDRQESETSPNAGDSLEIGNEKDDRAEYPETSSSERGLNQEAGTAPIDDQNPSIHNQGDPVRQEGLDKNKDYHHTGDQSYNDEQPKDTGIGSEDGIGPRQEEAHRQAREELSTATDSLDYASQRNADPEKVGNRIENMADSVSEKMHQKDRDKHGIED